MKVIILIIIFLNYNNEEYMFSESQELIHEWENSVEDELDSSEPIYLYAYGENFAETVWLDTLSNDESLLLTKSYCLIKKEELGFFLKEIIYSFSGDWLICCNHYFDKSESLYYIDWQMNTFQSLDGPLSISKILYFDENGVINKDSTLIYELNSNKKSNSDYLDREVEYNLKLSELEFYKHWNNFRR